MASSHAPSTTRRYVTYVLLGLVSLLFLFAGGSKVIGTEQMLANMAKIHWSAGAARALGGLEVILVALLWWRPARTLSLSLLLLIMAGAVGSHIATGDPLGQSAPQFAFSLLIAAALVADRGAALWRFLFRRGLHATASVGTSAEGRRPSTAGAEPA